METLFIFEYWQRDAQSPTKAVTLANSCEEALSRFSLDPDILEDPAVLMSISSVPEDQLRTALYYV